MPSKSDELRKLTKRDLTPLAKKFAQLYLSEEFYGNGTRAYIGANKIINNKDTAKETAKTIASRLLRDKKVCDYIASMIDDAGHNENNIDKHRLFNITQFNDLSVKQRAIESFDKIKGRIKKDLPDVNINILNYEQILINAGAISTQNESTHIRDKEELQSIQGEVSEDKDEEEPAYTL